MSEYQASTADADADADAAPAEEEGVVDRAGGASVEGTTTTTSSSGGETDPTAARATTTTTTTTTSEDPGSDGRRWSSAGMRGRLFQGWGLFGSGSGGGALSHPLEEPLLATGDDGDVDVV